MIRSCYIVHSVTRNRHTKEIREIAFINCVETEEQAIASLQYEADICRIENGEEGEWLDDYTFRLSDGWNPDEETILTYEISDYHDADEGLLKYEEEEE